MNIKSNVKALLGKCGVDVALRHEDQVGRDPFCDMQLFLRQIPNPVVFDVGANTGRTVEEFRSHFPKARIHSFEPSPDTYSQLHGRYANAAGVSTWNVGVGSADGQLALRENTCPDMSSFLEPGADAWGDVEKTTMVDVVTLDSFCSDRNIETIDVLKSDTQGYDLEVFKGCSRMIGENRIRMIYSEVIFSNLYRGQPSFDEVCRYLLDRRFALVAFYTFSFQERLAGWTDALFINRDFHRTTVPAGTSSR